MPELRGVLAGRPVRVGFVVLAAGLGGWAVARQWPAVRAGPATLGVPAVLGAQLLVLAALLPAMQVWRTVLAALGSPLPVVPAARVFFVGQLGKYLPGSVWPVLAQMELGRAHRVPPRRSATAAVLTMVVTLLGGLLTALLTLPWLAGTGAARYRWVFLAVPLLLAALHPVPLNRLLNLLLRLARRPTLEVPLTGPPVLRAVLWSLASWALYGAHVWLLVLALGTPPGRAALLAAGGFAFAWCVGFLVVLAPAGAGVRDVLLVALLGTLTGTGAATAVALLSRLLMTLGDLALAGLAAWSGRAGRGGAGLSPAAAPAAPPRPVP